MKQAEWLKITLTLYKHVDATAMALSWCKSFEIKFGIDFMYFARYESVSKSTIEVSALTTARTGAITSFAMRTGLIRGVKVEKRGTGSIAHAHAYQAVQTMTRWEKDTDGGIQQLTDVVHWMTNMYGYDYLRELRYYGYATYVFGNKLAKDNEAAIAAMRAGEVIGSDKGRGSRAAAACAADHQRRIAESSFAASGKAPGSSQTRSAGSSPRSPSEPSPGPRRSRKLKA